MKNHKQLLIITAINSGAILILALVVIFVHNRENTSSETPVENTTIENEEDKDAEENGETKEKPDTGAYLRDLPEGRDRQTVETLDDLKVEINIASWSWADKVGFLENVVKNENLEAIACWLPSEEINPSNLYSTISILVDDETLDDSLHSFWVEFSELEGSEAWLAVLEEAGGDGASIGATDDHEVFFEELDKLMIKHRAVEHPDNPDGLCLYDPEYLDYSIL